MIGNTQNAPWAVAVVGPTACGKSALSMRLANNFDAEIICCDSMQVYKGLDIGTGKPTKDDQRQVTSYFIPDRIRTRSFALHLDTFCVFVKMSLD